MKETITLSRRGFLNAVAALGSIGLIGCGTQSGQQAAVAAKDRVAAKLPDRGEFVVRGAQILTMDPASEISPAAISMCARARSLRWERIFEPQAVKLLMGGA